MVYCSKCGTTNSDTDAYCAGCGAPLDHGPFVTSPTPAQEYNSPYQPSPYAPVPTYPPVSYPTVSTVSNKLPVGANVTAIIAMVCGILSCCSLYVGFVFSIPAIILAAISKSKTPGGIPNGKSTAGLITGIIGIILSIIWIIIFVKLFEEVSTPSYYSDYYYYY